LLERFRFRRDLCSDVGSRCCLLGQKSTKPPKGHRRTKSDPMGGKPAKSTAKKQAAAGAKEQKAGLRKSISSAPISSSATKVKAHKRSSVAKSHKRTHSADSVPVNAIFSKESAPGSPYPHARRSSPASPNGFLGMSPPASPYHRMWTSPPTSPYTYNYGPVLSSPFNFNHRAQSWDVSCGYQHPSPGPGTADHGFKPVDGHSESSAPHGDHRRASQSHGKNSQGQRPQHNGFAPSSPTSYMPYPSSPHQSHMHSPYHRHHYPQHGGQSPGQTSSMPQRETHSEQRPSSIVIPELGQDNEKHTRPAGWFPKPHNNTNGSGGNSYEAPQNASDGRSLGPRPHHYPYYHGSVHYPRSSTSSPSQWPQPPPSPRQKTSSPDASQQQSWPNPPPPLQRQKDSPPSISGSHPSQQSRPPPSPRTGASSPSPGRPFHTSRPPPSPRQTSCSPGPGQSSSQPSQPRPPPSPGQGVSSPGSGSHFMPPPRHPASPNYGASSPRDGSHKTFRHQPSRGGNTRTSPISSNKIFSSTSSKLSRESRDEDSANVPGEKPRKAFTFVDGKLQESTEASSSKQKDGTSIREEMTSSQHVTPSPPERHHQRSHYSSENVSYRCSPEAVEAVESFDLSPVADIDQMDEDYHEGGVPRSPRKDRGDPALDSTDDIEVSPLPYQSNPLQEMSSSPLRELNENLLLLSPSSLSPPRGINMTPSSEDF